MFSRNVALMFLLGLLAGCSDRKSDLTACEYDIYKTLLIAGDKNLPDINAIGTDTKSRIENLITMCMEIRGYRWVPQKGRPLEESAYENLRWYGIR